MSQEAIILTFSGTMGTLVAAIFWAVRFIVYKAFGAEGNGGGAWGRLISVIEGMREDIRKNTEAVVKLETKIKFLPRQPATKKP